MSAAHTPGPWRTVGGTEVRAGARIVCDTATHHNPSAAADAALIAAAPELLEAARLALECILQHVPATTFAPREALRAALAKVQP